MDLPDEFKAYAEIYDPLPPLRKRIALQMMVAGAHMTNQIHIERAEEILSQQDAWLAQYISNYLTSKVI